MDLSVRWATAEDLKALLLIERSVFPDPWGEGALSSHLASESALALLLEREGRVIGEALGAILSGEGELYRIAVLPSERRCGYGKLLLQSFLDELGKKAANVCFLEVRESNLAALALYASFGFSLVGKRKKYYKDPPEDALLLRRG